MNDIVLPLLALACAIGSMWQRQRAIRAERACVIATAALVANHEWHVMYDDHDGYAGSVLCNTNRLALSALRKVG